MKTEISSKKQSIIKKLIEIRKKINKSNPGHTPQGELEQEIYIDLDELTGGLAGHIESLERKKILKFDLDNAHKWLERINGYISKIGEKKFRKNLEMSSEYDLCVEAISLMKEYNKIQRLEA